MGWKSQVICLSPLGLFLSGCPRAGPLKDSKLHKEWINFWKSRFLIHHKGEEHTLLSPKDPNHKFYVPMKNEQLINAAHENKKIKQVWVFMLLGSPANNISSPCAFEALTCVLLYARFQFFFTRRATCNHNLLAHKLA